MASACPAKNDLRAYAAGRNVAPRAAAAVEAHLAECAACRQWVQEWRDEETLATGLREAVGLGGDEDLRRRLQERLAGDYEVLEPVGRGAAGVVFKARDVRLKRLVAIKCPADAAQRDRLVAMVDEARTMARISHPNIVAIYALSEGPDLPFMAMEFVDGLPIDEAAAGWPLHQKIEAFRQVLDAVAELHRRGIVHRDLKPGNILVDRRGRPKVLDMGIAEEVRTGAADERPCRIAGTPAYLAPEQWRGDLPRPPADVFSLGILLFELLTGQRPFAGETARDVMRAICESAPPLPRALAGDIPGPLQAVCLTALEKDPALRYPTARHFLLDLERFMDGEAVAANPTLLQDVLEHGIDKHVADLNRWQTDRLISARELDYFAERYGRLREREEFWVLDTRRISFSQAMLHLGAWSCVVSAFLMVCFQWPHLTGAARVGLPLGIVAVLSAMGFFLWERRTRRVALVLLMAACLTWPLAAAAFFMTAKWGLAGGPDDSLPDLTNVELILVTGTWAALGLLLWWWTRTSAFALLWGLSALALATAVFLWSGMKHWDPDEIAVWYLVPGAALFGVAMALDLKWRQVYFAAPLYVMGLLVLLAALTYLAKEGPTTKWLGVDSIAHQLGIEAVDRGRQVKYSFILNGAAYLVLGLVADRSQASWWLRKTATLLFWLAPSHLLVPLRLLADQWALLPGGWTVPEVLLPVGALAFVFASVPKQMKSFFLSGLGYLAVAIQRLTAEHFQDVYAWPLGLAAAGLTLAMVAWRRPGMFDRAAPRAGVTSARTSPRG